MRSRRWLHPLLIAALSVTGFGAGFGAAEAGPTGGAAVCTWGGTEAAPTGWFTVQPGLHTTPSGVPSRFVVHGQLAGDSSSCTGDMSLHGTIVPGSSCTLNIGYARVGGVPGVASDTNVGVTFVVRGTLFGSDGSVVGSYDDSVLSNGVKESADRCASEAGFTGGPHWAVVTLYPSGV